MRLERVIVANQVLKNIIDDTKISVDSVTKFKLLGIMKKIEPYCANFETIRNEKIKEYGTKDEESGNISISNDDKEAIEKFQKDLTELTNTEVDVEIKIKAKDILDKGIPAEYLVMLYDFIEK